jgi:hypothetical protein
MLGVRHMEFDPVKTARTIIQIFSQIQTIGDSVLSEDLAKSKPYNHEKPDGSYDEKNLYFNRANVAGIPLLNMGVTGLSKIYYWKLLNQITAYEKSKFKLNKGMVSANLGVSDLAEGDIDGGIAHLLWASYEDRYWIKASYTYDAFQMKLYTQFANGETRDGSSQFGGPAPHVLLETAVQAYNMLASAKFTKNSIFGELKDNDEHRAILEGALWTIARNLPILEEEHRTIFDKGQNNIYTRLRLFNGLVDLCRFIELRIRHHENPPREVKMLGQLFDYTFGNKSLTWFNNDVKRNIRSPQTGTEFDDFLKNCHGLGFPSSNILQLWGTRNYSVHVCDPKTPYLFSNFARIFNDIIAAYIFYLQHKGVIK